MNPNLRRFQTLRIALAVASLLAMAMGSVAQAQGGLPQPPPELAPSTAVKLVKTAEVASDLNLGGSFAYQLTVSNNSARPVTALLIDLMPPQVDLDGAPQVSSSGTITTLATPPHPVDAFGWNGQLAPGAVLTVRIPVKLVACPLAVPAWPLSVERVVRNTATLAVGASRQAASHAFLPGGCPTLPSPTGVPTATPPTVIPPVTGADLGLRHLAMLHPDFERPERGWVASWFVGYRNVGGTTATAASLIDALSDNQTLFGMRSAPTITPTLSNGVYTFSLGDLGASRGGALLLRTGVSFTTPAGTVLSNRAALDSPDDTNLANNGSAISLTVPSLPPLITYPRSGSTCTGTLTIHGKAQAGSLVDVEIGERSAGSATADASGDWSLAVQLPDGVHQIQALIRAASGAIRRSPLVMLRGRQHAAVGSDQLEVRGR